MVRICVRFQVAKKLGQCPTLLAVQTVGIAPGILFKNINFEQEIKYEIQKHQAKKNPTKQPTKWGFPNNFTKVLRETRFDNITTEVILKFFDDKTDRTAIKIKGCVVGCQKRKTPPIPPKNPFKINWKLNL